jgi:hypothetical protein
MLWTLPGSAGMESFSASVQHQGIYKDKRKARFGKSKILAAQEGDAGCNIMIDVDGCEAQYSVYAIANGTAPQTT